MGSEVKFIKKNYVWRHYEVKMMRHLNTRERMSEKVYDVIWTSSLAQRMGLSLCKIWFVCLKGSEVKRGPESASPQFEGVYIGIN